MSINLTDSEAMSLAFRLAADHLKHSEWLQWEDLPNLTENAFARLETAVETVSDVVGGMGRDMDHGRFTNSSKLLEQATR